MTTRSHVTMNNRSIAVDIFSWFSGIVFFAIGVINTFWGNDMAFGIFIIGLSFAFFPPVTEWVREKIGIKVPGIAKIGLGLLIVWAAIGVGELFAKIDLMMNSF